MDMGPLVCGDEGPFLSEGIIIKDMPTLKKGGLAARMTQLRKGHGLAIEALKPLSTMHEEYITRVMTTNNL